MVIKKLLDASVDWLFDKLGRPALGDSNYYKGLLIIYACGALFILATGVLWVTVLMGLVTWL
ncbi:hypothetical protein LCGC14_1133330 [marine sediment metagenome]|uniref:Uncharacterized protein n=1 Tax=marine sediment metagenome TaxID=412755 RepID=A0A0F9MNC2_9ZZZZ